jgi:hypothetical protein
VVLYVTFGPTLPNGAAAAAPLLGEEIFERMLASRSGFVFTAHEYDARKGRSHV